MSGDTARDTLLSGLERRLGRRFVDRALLEQALTHSSFARENTGGSLGDYERLEFLGDAILGMLVAEHLYRDDPTASEGELTQRRKGVVSMPALAPVARRLELGPSLRLGRGEEASGGRERDSLLADALEAVLGAIYLDGGVRAARAFVRRCLFSPAGAQSRSATSGRDAKTELQELWQARSRLTPRYRTVATIGPPHAREFKVEVLAGDRVLAEGHGRNRQGAEQDAAASALLALKDGGVSD